MFGRIRNLLTPPPSRSTEQAPEPTPAPSSREEEAKFNADLRQSIEALISAPGLRSSEAVQAVETLKALAKARGPYVTAARIRMQLEARKPDSAINSLNGLKPYLV